MRDLVQSFRSRPKTAFQLFLSRLTVVPSELCHYRALLSLVTYLFSNLPVTMLKLRYW